MEPYDPFAMYIVYSKYIYMYIYHKYIYIYICVFTFARAREGDYQRGLVAISAFIRAVKDEKARKLCFFLWAPMSVRSVK